MIRYAIAAMLVAALLTGAAAGEKNKPKLTQETKEGVQITQENIVKMKLRTVQPAPQIPSPPPPPVSSGP